MVVSHICLLVCLIILEGGAFGSLYYVLAALSGCGEIVVELFLFFVGLGFHFCQVCFLYDGLIVEHFLCESGLMFLFLLFGSDDEIVLRFRLGHEVHGLFFHLRAVAFGGEDAVDELWLAAQTL